MKKIEADGTYRVSAGSWPSWGRELRLYADGRLIARSVQARAVDTLHVWTIARLDAGTLLSLTLDGEALAATHLSVQKVG